MRPKTLAEVAQLALSGDSFDRCLANFLDEFYATPNTEARGDTPLLLAPTLGEKGQVQDAYLTATAEELLTQTITPALAHRMGEGEGARRSRRADRGL